jgi:hypothetical protein
MKHEAKGHRFFCVGDRATEEHNIAPAWPPISLPHSTLEPKTKNRHLISLFAINLSILYFEKGLSWMSP